MTFGAWFKDDDVQSEIRNEGQKLGCPSSSFSSRYWASAGYQNGKVSQPRLLFRNTLKQCDGSKNTLQYPIVYRLQINLLSQVIIASQLGSFWARLIDLFTQTAKLGKFYNIPGDINSLRSKGIPRTVLPLHTVVPRNVSSWVLKANRITFFRHFNTSPKQGKLPFVMLTM